MSTSELGWSTSTPSTLSRSSAVSTSTWALSAASCATSRSFAPWRPCRTAVGSGKLRPQQLLIGQRMAIIGKAEDMSELCTRISKLPFGDGVAELGVNFDHAAEASEITGTLRETSTLTTPVTCSSGVVFAQFRGGQRELLGMVHLDQVHVGFIFDLRRRRRFGLGSGWPWPGSQPSPAPTPQERNRSCPCELHGITSRPTARFNCPAAVR